MDMPDKRKSAEVEVTFTHSGESGGEEKIEQFFRALARHHMREAKKQDEGQEPDVDWRKEPRKRKLTPPE